MANSRYRAMSEEDCAAMGKYIYARQNIQSASIDRVQRLDITASVIIVDEYPIQCSCLLVNGRKCYSDKCPNYKRRIACGPSCGANCCNRPWANDLFVANTKTRMGDSGKKGLGVFATSFIPAFTFIGEFTGKVTLDTQDFSEIQQAYLFEIEPKGYVIQSFEQGSRLRCVNHSCDPNCEATEWVDEMRIKLVFCSIRDIQVGEELGLDYKYKFSSIDEAMKCYCGAPNCRNYIGTLVTSSTGKAIKSSRIKTRAKVPNRGNNGSESTISEGFPIPFRSIMIQSSSDVAGLVSSTPSHQQRPEAYLETHIFVACEPAFAIVQYNNRLGIVLGRITECYYSNFGIAIYVLITTWPTAMEYHIPRFLLFHYHEDTGFVLQFEMSNEERRQAEIYSTPYASREDAMNLKNNIAVTYSKRWESGHLEQRRMVRMKIQGLVALGLPLYRLVAICPETEVINECTTNIVPPKPINVEKEQKARKTRKVAESAAELEMDIHRRLLLQEPQPSSSRAIRNDATNICPVPTPQLVRPGLLYSQDNRRPFEDTQNQLRRENLMGRLVYYATENVSSFAYSRFSRTDQTSIGRIRTRVSTVLNYFYTEAPVQQRRFLTGLHFSFANEANEPSSNASHICSFCKKNHNNRQSLLNHAHDCHLIVSEYSCSLCLTKYSLPTMMRNHLFGCDPDLGFQLLLNVSPQIMDAFADFAAARSSNNSQQLIYAPGLPVFNARSSQLSIQQTFNNTMTNWPQHEHFGNATDNLINNQQDQPVAGPSRQNTDKPRSKKRSRHDVLQEDETDDRREQDGQNYDDDEQMSDQHRAAETRDVTTRRPRSKKQTTRDVRVQDPPETENSELEIDPPSCSRSKSRVAKQDTQKKKSKPASSRYQPDLNVSKRKTRAATGASKRPPPPTPQPATTSTESDDDFDVSEWKP